MVGFTVGFLLKIEQLHYPLLLTPSVKGKTMVDLREHEQKTLSTLAKLGGKTSAENLISQSGLSDAAVMRSALTLQDKKLVQINEEEETIARLNAEGKMYAANGLPERQVIRALSRLGGKAPLGGIFEKAELGKETCSYRVRLDSKKEMGNSGLESKHSAVAGKTRRGER